MFPSSRTLQILRLCTEQNIESVVDDNKIGQDNNGGSVPEIVNNEGMELLVADCGAYQQILPGNEMENNSSLDFQNFEVYTEDGLNLTEVYDGISENLPITSVEIVNVDRLEEAGTKHNEINDPNTYYHLITENEDIMVNDTISSHSHDDFNKENEQVNRHSNTDNEVDQRDMDYIPLSDHDQENDENREKSVENKKWSLKLRTERKKNRNSGKEYRKINGGIRKDRKMRELRICRMKCKERIPDEKRKLIFDAYWSLGSYEKRVQFVTRSVTIKDKLISRNKIEGKMHKNREHTFLYNFEIENKLEPVCKDCFLNTLDETNKFAYKAVKNKLEAPLGVPKGDLRGKHPSNVLSEDAIEKVNNHIASFPAYESHYSRRHTSKKYLGAHLNLSIMYDLYCQIEEKPVSKSTYRNLFKKTDLKFKKPALDTCCGTCDSLAILKKSAEGQTAAEAEEKLKTHHAEADLAYDKKKEDKNIARDSTHIKVFTFDLQQVLPVPLLTAGEVFYKRQYSVYNLTVHDCVTGSSFHYMWGESTAKRGSTEIASCLYHLLTNIQPEVKHVIFYSDTCGGQNKNSNVIAMFMYALKYNPNIEIIEHKFLVPGHTHMECDSDHSIIERKSKRSPFPIQLPRDWYQLVRIAGKKNSRFEVKVMAQEDFFDFSELFKKYLQKKKLNTEQEQFNFRTIKWLRFGKDFGLFQYKTSLHGDVDFKAMSYRRKKHLNMPADYKISHPYKQTLAISEKKKANLLSLCDKLDADVRQFYENLPTQNMPDIDPDLDLLEEDDE